MRYDSPVLYVVRKTTKDVVVHGVTIPADKPVLLCGVAANRDPEVFTDPDVFNIDREQKVNHHLALGYGVHSCLGAALVIWEESRRVNASTVAGWSHLPVKVG